MKRRIFSLSDCVQMLGEVVVMSFGGADE